MLDRVCIPRSAVIKKSHRITRNHRPRMHRVRGSIDPHFFKWGSKDILLDPHFYQRHSLRPLRTHYWAVIGLFFSRRAQQSAADSLSVNQLRNFKEPKVWVNSALCLESKQSAICPKCPILRTKFLNFYGGPTVDPRCGRGHPLAHQPPAVRGLLTPVRHHSSLTPPPVSNRLPSA